jgi:hypothetical protein
MEFLLYLTPTANQIIDNVIKAGYPVKENIGYCRDKKYFGYGDFDKLVICTKNIKEGGYDLKRYVNETIYHEAIHIAHMCNGYKPFYISLKDMPLPPNKLQDVQKSVKASNASRQMEHEAFWMEDKPDKVNYVLEKYCF